MLNSFNNRISNELKDIWSKTILKLLWILYQVSCRCIVCVCKIVYTCSYLTVLLSVVFYLQIAPTHNVSNCLVK